VVLFGGGLKPTHHQAAEMQALLAPILVKNKWISVTNESKPLTAAQVFQVLTEDAAELSETEKKIYFNFVARLIPHHNLKAVRRYALNKDTKSLKHAFKGFLELFNSESLDDHLRLLGIYPKGGNRDDPITPELRALQREVPKKIELALEFSRDL